MKILFDNKLLDATITASYASDNYPVSNLIDDFLTVRYQHLSSVYDTVIFEFDEETDINSFFFAYSNSSEARIYLYDSDDTLLDSETVSQDDSFGNVAQAVHFSETYSVKSIHMRVYGSSGTYLGGVGAGVAEEFKNVLGSWSEEWEDNTIINSSTTGQSTRNKVSPLRVQSWEFMDYSTTRKNEISELYYTYGLGAKVWIDPTEDNHSFKTPMYAIIAASPSASKNGTHWDLSWDFKETK